MKKLLRVLLVIIALTCLVNSRTSRAQSAITVQQDQVKSNYPSSLTFQLTASSEAEIQEVTLLYRANGATCQPAQAQQEVDITQATSIEAEWEWDFTRSGILPPGAIVYWQWEIIDAAGNTLLTEEQNYLVNDTRHDWKLLSNDQLSLQWYQGSQSFGQSLQTIAIHALERLADEAGVNPTGTIWITVYPTSSELKEVDIHTQEWAGGIAYPEFNSTIMSIATSELDWAESVIPHELAHLVTEAVVFNCKGMWVPTWLNEGIAMFSEGEMASYFTDMVMDALEAGELPPLRTLESGFSSDSEAANLSYGQSGMIVTYMIDTYGAEKMADLLSAISSGNKIDKALQAAYKMDTDGIESGWRVSLGFAPQPTRAPTNANRTAVPTLALFTSAVKPSATPTPQPSLTPPPPPPTVTPLPLPSLASAKADISTVAPQADPTATGSSPQLIIIIIVVIIVVAVGILSFILIRKRRQSL